MNPIALKPYYDYLDNKIFIVKKYNEWLDLIADEVNQFESLTDEIKDEEAKSLLLKKIKTLKHLNKAHDWELYLANVKQHLNEALAEYSNVNNLKVPEEEIIKSFIESFEEHLSESLLNVHSKIFYAC